MAKSLKTQTSFDTAQVAAPDSGTYNSCCVGDVFEVAGELSAGHLHKTIIDSISAGSTICSPRGPDGSGPELSFICRLVGD